MQAARAAALTVLVAVALRLVYGPGHLGYDAAWALEWGREALAGATPAFEGAGAPTPHPLANAVSLALAPLGGSAFAVVMALSWLSLAALGVLGFLLGRRLYGVWVGAAVAVVLLTRPLLVGETHQAVLDLPFLALVVGALFAEAGRPRERTLVPVLLCLAGLLRPEGWLLGLAWLLYAAPGHPRAQVLRWGALVVAAPLVWALWDLVVTGDPLWSLHGTRELAEELERPRAIDTALSAVPSYLRDALGDPIVWLGLAGAAGGLLSFYERSLLPAALAAAGMLGFLALGLADLPLLIRYLLVPAVMLCLFCGLLAFGWTALPRSDPAWRAWVAGGVVCLVVTAALRPEAGAGAEPRARAGRDHREGPGRPAPPDPRPLVPRRRGALRHDQPARRAAAAAAGLLAGALTRRDQGRRAPGGTRPRLCQERGGGERFALTAPIPPAGSEALPARGRHVARNASWLVVERC